MTKQQEMVREMVDAAEAAGWDKQSRLCELRMSCNVFLVMSQQGGMADSLAHLARLHKSKAAAAMLVALAEHSLEFLPIMEDAAKLMANPLNMEGMRETLSNTIADYREML